MYKTLCLLFFILSNQVIVHCQLRYTSDGQAYELEFIRLRNVDSVQHLTTFHSNGRKRTESFFRKGHSFDTLRAWDQQGKLYWLKVFKDSSYFEKRYFEKDFWEEGWYKELAVAPGERTIRDSSTWTVYSVKDYERKPYYIRMGTWKVFQETGVMIAQGSFLPESFESSQPARNVIKKGFESSDWYFLGGAKFSGFYAGGVGYLKNGEWIYYNDIGYEIYREFYKEGLKVK
ncbi:hypothetical protein CNR22_15005 [Sphingobacteriaceae bacterium]|nr:hypothetical protein CNR22_15005 [Sphingobacteriaceae bacterium]